MHTKYLCMDSNIFQARWLPLLYMMDPSLGYHPLPAPKDRYILIRRGLQVRMPSLEQQLRQKANILPQNCTRQHMLAANKIYVPTFPT